jgi:hypothetical protein
MTETLPQCHIKWNIRQLTVSSGNVPQNKTALSYKMHWRRREPTTMNGTIFIIASCEPQNADHLPVHPYRLRTITPPPHHHKVQAVILLWHRKANFVIKHFETPPLVFPPVNCNVITYLLIAIGLSPGGSTHLHTNNT